VFEDEELVALARRAVTCLVRVPEAYQLVRKHKAVRPGFLLLDAEGRKRGSVTLVAADPDGSARRAKQYLRRALEAPGAIPDDHRGAPDPSTQTGRFEVGEVEAGTPAEAAGLRRGDRLLEVNGRPVGTLGDLAWSAKARPAGEPSRYVFERDGERIEVREEGKLGVRWVFVLDQAPKKQRRLTPRRRADRRRGRGRTPSPWPRRTSGPR